MFVSSILFFKYYLLTEYAPLFIFLLYFKTKISSILKGFFHYTGYTTFVFTNLLFLGGLLALQFYNATNIESIVYFVEEEIIENNNEMEILITSNNKEVNKETELCPICYELVPSVKTLCGHSFCKKCLYKSLQKNDNCPYCRQKISYEIKKVFDLIELENTV